MRIARIAPLLLAASVAPGALAATTPVGAELDGNADGSIPAWNGGLLPMAWPEDFTPDSLPDPYPRDTPLFTINARNWRGYADKLSAGHRALFERDADFRMPVYPTRRSVSFPEAIEAATSANRGVARLRGADRIEGATLGIPFAAPRTGVEVLWNHRLRYRGDASEWHYTRASVFGDTRQAGEGSERWLFGYANVHWRERPDMLSWARMRMWPAEDVPDYTALWHDALNLLDRPRRVWGAQSTWKPMRHPPLGYDQVGIFSYRIRYFDMVDMFSGSFERYSFRLVGKQERYVPYNAYRLAMQGASALGPNHLDPAQARYELHRVWIVEASLRPETGHAIRKRTFYVDEDSWSVLMVDGWDPAGRLARFQEGHLLALYAAQAVDYAPLVTYDLIDNRYFVDRLLGGRAPRLDVKLSPGDFQPAAVKSLVSR